MEGGERKHPNYWNPLEWPWKFSPEDWQYLCGTGEVAYARKLGSNLALSATAICAAYAFFSLPAGFAAPGNQRLWLASAGLYVALAALVRQGKGWASLAMIAMFTATVVIPNVAFFRMPGPVFGDHSVCWACSVIVSGACWTLWMRLYWVAYRLERRAAKASADMGA